MVGWLRGRLHPNQKLACFVLYLKVINTFLRKKYASYSKLSKEIKKGIKISVDQATLEILTKTLFKNRLTY